MASATAGTTPIDPPLYYDNAILDASCIPAALGKCAAERDSLREVHHLHLTDQQKLMGHLHPDDICGTNAFDLAKRHSNAFMAICIKIISLICDLTYPTSNFVVARVNQPLDHHAGLVQTKRPKAANAKTIPRTTTWALLDKAPEAGRWMEITIDEGNINYKFLTDQEVRDLDLVRRLQNLRRTAGTQPAQPARLGSVAAPQTVQATTSLTPTGNGLQLTGSTSQAAGSSQPAAPMPSYPTQAQHAISVHQTQPMPGSFSSGDEGLTTGSNFATQVSPSSYGLTGTSVVNSQSFNNGALASRAPPAFSPAPALVQQLQATSSASVLKRAHEDTDDEEEPEGPVQKRYRRDPGPARAVSHALDSAPRKITALPARKKAQVEAMNPLLLDPQLGGSTQAPRMLAEPRKSKRASRRQHVQSLTMGAQAVQVAASYHTGLMGTLAMDLTAGEAEQVYNYVLPTLGMHLPDGKPYYSRVSHVMQAGFETTGV